MSDHGVAIETDACGDSSSSSSGNDHTIRRDRPQRASVGGPRSDARAKGLPVISTSDDDDDDATVREPRSRPAFPTTQPDSDSESSSDDATRPRQRSGPSSNERQAGSGGRAAVVPLIRRNDQSSVPIASLRRLDARQVRRCVRRPRDRLAALDRGFVAVAGKLDGRIDVVIVTAEEATLEQVQALSTVHHPNLATILGYLPSPSADDRLAFVISVYAPVTLAAWMDSSAMLGPYTEKLYVKRLTVLGHVAKGVAFLHSRGVVHGAIGTSTVLIEDRSPPKARVFGGGLLVDGGTEAEDVHAVQSLTWTVLMSDRTVCTATRTGTYEDCLDNVFVYRRGDRFAVEWGDDLREAKRRLCIKGPVASALVRWDDMGWGSVPPPPVTVDDALATLGALVGYATAGTRDLTEAAEAIECERDHPRKGWKVEHMRALRGTLDVSVADYDLTVLAGDETTVLMAAVMGRHERLVRALLDTIGDDGDALNAFDENWRTALWYAASQGDLPCLEALLRNSSVDPNLGDEADVTPLEVVATAVGMHAALRAKMIGLLLQAGAEPFDGFDEVVGVIGGGDGGSISSAASNSGGSNADVSVVTARSATVPAAAASANAPLNVAAASLCNRFSSRPELSFVDPAEVSLGHKLGSGGFGTVYTATLHGAVVVVKTVKRLVLHEFMAEVVALVEITHPNALEYVGVTVANGFEAAIVTEYMDGGDLIERIQGAPQMPFAVGDRLSILAQTAAALAYVHAMGLVHRDIKPHNIFLSASEPVVAKLGDFGLTSAASAATSGGFTPQYAPPEVLHGAQAGTAASDVFSFGLVIFEALALERCCTATHRGTNGFPVRDLGSAVAPLQAWEDSTAAQVVEAFLVECFDSEPCNRPIASAVADLCEVLKEASKRNDAAGLFRAAVACGHVSVLERMPGQGPDANARVDGTRTALGLAAERGHVDMVGRLLSAGAEVNAKGRLGWTPLERAALGGHLLCVEALLGHGADCSPLALSGAAGQDFGTVVAALLAAGADPNGLAERDGSRSMYAFDAAAPILVAESGGGGEPAWRVIHTAAEAGAAGAMGALLRADPEVEAQDEDGRTAMAIAAEAGHLGCVVVLLEAGAEVTAAAVDAATNHGHDDVVELLRESAGGEG